MPKIVDHDARRQAFAEAAFRVIAKGGIAALTMRNVAKEACYTTGALVHYFKSKDQLLIAAAGQLAKVVGARVERNAQGHEGIETLRNVLHGALPTTPEMRGLWNVWLGFWDGAIHSRAVRQMTTTRYRQWQARIAEFVAQAQRAGDISPRVDTEIAALSIVSLLDGIGARVLLAGGEISPKRQRELIDVLIDNLPQGARKAQRAKRRPAGGRRLAA